MIISLAPLQGYTEFPLRNALHRHIGGVDKFYTPFLRFENDGTLRKKYLRDILPEHNKGMHLIPQILVNTTSQFVELASIISDFGYTELNWNMGCPYPMVANRKLGSGLLAYPDIITDILENALPKTNLKLSVKMRLGYANENEIFDAVQVLNQFNISEIIVHPRIGKMLYKGAANTDQFLNILPHSKHPVAYNGDIIGLEQVMQLQRRYANLSHMMIGRGLLANPFLGLQIKGITISEDEKRERFQRFYYDIEQQYQIILSGEAHLLQRMQLLWEYFSQLFENEKKIYKAVKKARNINQYHSLLNDILLHQPVKKA